MALKAKITKAEYDALTDTVKKEYVDNGDGEYTLDIEGAEDTGALKRALAREKQEKKDAAKRLQELEAERDALKEKTETKTGEKTAKQIEKEWKEKYDGDIAKRDARLTAVQAQLRNERANALATELFTVPKVGVKYIIDRIKVDFDDDGTPVVKYLHEDGTEDAALTADAFKKEIKSNKDLAAVLIGSKGSGGGANGANGGGGGGATQTKAFKELNALERSELFRTDPERFKRESDAARSSQAVRI